MLVDGGSNTWAPSFGKMAGHWLFIVMEALANKLSKPKFGTWNTQEYMEHNKTFE